MTEELCYWLVCFAPPIESTVPRIFGFAEFISALALLVITYTLVDVRYRFRLAIAPSPLYSLTFAIIGVIGAETLITEVWLAQGWWLPKTAFLTRALWQGFFGSLFLAAFMTWVWYAYIRPPIYGRRNYNRFAQELYSVIVKGNDNELAIIADELRRSARTLIFFAPSNPRRFASPENEADSKKPPLSKVDGYANDILLLIANRKLCRHIVASAPATAIVIFAESVEAKKFHLSLGAFAKNITAEAIANRDSLLFHETDAFSSGLIGHLQPFSRAIFGNYALLEGLGERFGSPLDVGYQDYLEWTAPQWKAYCRAVVTAIGAYVSQTRGTQHSFAILRAVGNIKSAFRDVHKLNESTTDYASDTSQRLDAAVEFIRDAVEEIDKHERPPAPQVWRRRQSDHNRDIYDCLANLMYELVFAASSVSGPPGKAWSVHHNAVWGQFFGLGADGRTWKILQFKLRRLLYDEIASLNEFPNFKNARILGYCLNVMGLKLHPGTHGRSYRPLAKAVRAVASRSYTTMLKEFPRVADAVLIGGITYDSERSRLVKTYLQGLREEPSKEFLQLIALPGHSE